MQLIQISRVFVVRVNCFEVKVSMHQGSALSPLLFVIVMEASSREFTIAYSVDVAYLCLSDWTHLRIMRVILCMRCGYTSLHIWTVGRTCECSCLHVGIIMDNFQCSVVSIIFFICCQWSLTSRYFHSASSTLSLTILLYSSRLFLLEFPYMHSGFELLTQQSYLCSSSSGFSGAK